MLVVEVLGLLSTIWKGDVKHLRGQELRPDARHRFCRGPECQNISQADLFTCCREEPGRANEMVGRVGENAFA
eukprot:4713207-Amphidinium_carterae.1